MHEAQAYKCEHTVVVLMLPCKREAVEVPARLQMNYYFPWTTVSVETVITDKGQAIISDQGRRRLLWRIQAL